MNKVWQTIRKNLLMLLRSKVSSIAILFGPVLIMLLIGLAFTTPANLDLAIGISVSNESTLTSRFVENMEQQGFIIEQYQTIEECTSLIQEGRLQSCIKFPDDFRIENNKTNEIVFYVDESRTNFVYEIIETVDSNLGVETAELSQDLTGDILTLMWSTEENLDQAIAQAITLKAETKKLEDSSSDISTTTQNIDLDYERLDESDLEDQAEITLSLTEDLLSDGDTILAAGRSIVRQLEDESYAGTADISSFETKLDTFSEALSNAEDDYDDASDDFAASLSDLSDHLDDIEDQFTAAEEEQGGIIEDIASLQSKISDLHSKIDEHKAHLEMMKTNINNLKITSSETISRPIVTRIEPMTSHGNKLTYLYSYLLMLVVAFIGLLLPSTLVVMEKRSKSSFRTFTTPTKDRVFMAAHFLTAFIIIIMQIAILLGITYYFLGTDLIANYLVTGTVLLLGIILFVLMGMAIGYLFNTQEAVTMVSISLGSLFIFLSNLVLPLETLAGQFKELLMFNPYVLSSETMRRALLFGASFKTLQIELISLAAASAILLVIMVVIKDINKSRYYLHLTFGKRVTNPKDTYLHIGEVTIKNLDDLLEWLKSVDNKEFKEELKWSQLRKWLAHERRLRVRLAGKSRSKMIKILEKKLKK